MSRAPRYPRIVLHQGSGQPETCLAGLMAWAEAQARHPHAARFPTLHDFVQWSWKQKVRWDHGEAPHVQGCHPPQRGRSWEEVEAFGCNCFEITALMLAAAMREGAQLELHVYDAPVLGQRHVFPAVRHIGDGRPPCPIVLQPAPDRRAEAPDHHVVDPAKAPALARHAQGLYAGVIAQGMRANDLWGDFAKGVSIATPILAMVAGAEGGPAAGQMVGALGQVGAAELQSQSHSAPPAPRPPAARPVGAPPPGAPPPGAPPAVVLAPAPVYQQPASSVDPGLVSAAVQQYLAAHPPVSPTKPAPKPVATPAVQQYIAEEERAQAATPTSTRGKKGRKRKHHHHHSSQWDWSPPPSDTDAQPSGHGRSGGGLLSALGGALGGGLVSSLVGGSGGNAGVGEDDNGEEEDDDDTAQGVGDAGAGAGSDTGVSTSPGQPVVSPPPDQPVSPPPGQPAVSTTPDQAVTTPPKNRGVGHF